MMDQTRLINPTSATQAICVVVHGRGQSQDDMMAGIVERLEAPHVRFVLPKSAGPGWYAARAIDPLTEISRAELAASLAALSGVIDAARADAPGVPMLLVGFSQGACLSVEYLMQGGTADGAALLTGCRVGVRSDALPVADLSGMKVYATCGDADPWIPAGAHFDMLGDLTRAGARIRADMFPGRPHEVCGPEIAMLQSMLDTLVAGRDLLNGDE